MSPEPLSYAEKVKRGQKARRLEGFAGWNEKLIRELYIPRGQKRQVYVSSLGHARLRAMCEAWIELDSVRTGTNSRVKKIALQKMVDVCIASMWHSFRWQCFRMRKKHPEQADRIDGIRERAKELTVEAMSTVQADPFKDEPENSTEPLSATEQFAVESAETIHSLLRRQ